MKIPRSRPRANFWTPEEDALLLETKHMTEKQASDYLVDKLPNRTISAIRNRKSLIGAGRFSDQKRRKWTDADYEFMRANPHMNDAEMAEVLKARVASLAAARKKANIRKVHHCKKCGVQLSQQGVYCVDHQKYARRWAYYRNRAKTRGLDFDLPLEAFHALLDGACHYCGDEGSGIDRIDSTKGYTKENTVSCCWACNAMKSSHTTAAWVAHMRKVIDKIGASA
jgi:hypothetical protein